MGQLPKCHFDCNQRISATGPKCKGSNDRHIEDCLHKARCLKSLSRSGLTVQAKKALTPQKQELFPSTIAFETRGAVKTGSFSTLICNIFELELLLD